MPIIHVLREKIKPDRSTAHPPDRDTLVLQSTHTISVTPFPRSSVP